LAVLAIGALVVLLWLLLFSPGGMIGPPGGFN
jgi:hypothetical protein